MHIVNTLLMILSILKTINSVKNENYHCYYHLNKLLSASAWSSLSHLIISVMNCLMSLFSSSRNAVSNYSQRQLISTCTFPFQNLSSHYVVRYQVGLSCTCKEYSKNIQFLATSPYHYSTTYTSCESLRNI